MAITTLQWEKIGKEKRREITLEVWKNTALHESFAKLVKWSVCEMIILLPIFEKDISYLDDVLVKSVEIQAARDTSKAEQNQNFHSNHTFNKFWYSNFDFE